MRDSFIFYRSFFEATKPLNAEQKASLFDAICRYSLDLEEMQLDPICEAMFALIKPQLDANYKRWENSKKGGRPNQTKTKVKPKRNQKLTKLKPNVNVNDNDNDNVNENIHTHFKHLSITYSDYNKLEIVYGADKVKEILEQIENFKNNKKYTSLYLTAKNWLKRDKLNEKKDEKKRSSDFSKKRAFGVSL